MRRFAGSLVAMLMLASMASAQQVVTEKVGINNLTAGQVVQALKADGLVPPSVTQVSFNAEDNSVTVQGSASGVAQVKAALHTLDVQPRRVEVRVRLLRVQVSPEGTRTEKTLQAPVVTTTNDSKATVSLISRKNGAVVEGTTFEVTPHLESDHSVTLSVTLRQEGIGAGHMAATRRVRLGQAVRMTGMTDFQDKRVQEAVRRGLVPEHSGTFQADYLEATTVELGNGPDSTTKP